jgi:hypothetical protein
MEKVAEAIVEMSLDQTLTNKFRFYPINGGSAMQAEERVGLLYEKIVEKMTMLDKSIKVEEVRTVSPNEFTIEICSSPGLSIKIVLNVLELASQLGMAFAPRRIK